MAFSDETVWRPLIQGAKRSQVLIWRHTTLANDTGFMHSLFHLRKLIHDLDASPFDPLLQAQFDHELTAIRSCGAIARLAAIEDIIVNAKACMPRDEAITYLMQGKPHTAARREEGNWRAFQRWFLGRRYDEDLHMAAWLLMSDSDREDMWQAASTLIGLIKPHVPLLALRPGLNRMRDRASGPLRVNLDHDLARLFR